MQKRSFDQCKSKPDLNLLNSPIELCPEFPFTGLSKEGLHTLDSEPLTFLHYHDKLEIGYCYEGSGIFLVNDKIMSFSKGDASVVFRNEVHIAKSNPESPSSWHFVYLDPMLLLNDIGSRELPRLFACLDGNNGFTNVIKANEDLELVMVIMEIIEEIRWQRDLYKDAVKGLALCMLARLSRSIMKSTPSDILYTRHNNIVRISPALDHIFKNHNRQISIFELAELCAMSPSSLRRIFSKTIRLSPLEFMNHFRINMASVLLTSTDIPVLDVSLRVGYESLSSFNRHFKQIMGVSPREWRKL